MTSALSEDDLRPQSRSKATKSPSSPESTMAGELTASPSPVGVGEFHTGVIQLVGQLRCRLSDDANELLDFSMCGGEYLYTVRDLAGVLVRDAVPISRTEFDLLERLLERAGRTVKPQLEALVQDDGDLVIGVRDWLGELVEPLYVSLFPRMPQEVRRWLHIAREGGEWGYLLEDIVNQVDEHHVPVTPEEAESIRHAMSQMRWKFKDYPPATEKWGVVFLPEPPVTDAQRLRATVFRIADAVLNEVPSSARRPIATQLRRGRWPYIDAFVGMVDAIAEHRLQVTADVVADARWVVDHLAPRYPDIESNIDTIEAWVVTKPDRG